MDRAALRICFIPVSGARGAGEFMRCAILARAIQQRWSTAEIAFAVSREASYASSVGFPMRLLDRSPTFETPAIAEWLQELRPTIVVFDGTARRAQIQLAKTLGAHTIFISSRPRARRKVMRWRHLQSLDEIWFTQPSMLEPPLSWWERNKLRYARAVAVKFLGPIFEPVEPLRQARTLAACEAQPGELIVLCPGGGALGGDGSVLEIFVSVANALASTRGVRCVVVAGAQELPELVSHPGVRVLGLLPNGELMDLLGAARLAITNGGALVAQALALGVPILGVPVMSDQPQRLRALQALQLVATAPLDAASIVNAAQELLDSESARRQQQTAQRRYSIANGLLEALRSIESAAGLALPGKPLDPVRERC